MAEGEGFEPSVSVTQYTGLANQRLKPLGHPSSAWTRAVAMPSEHAETSPDPQKGRKMAAPSRVVNQEHRAENRFPLFGTML